ncbi:hypothetical protein [Streptomyces sp. NPDC004528]|uniref:hypothetical protein n=1 Tax=Streptomyces sp. NPDC004528 TaxID=3154550 RepID=UPI0033A128B9
MDRLIRSKMLHAVLDVVGTVTALVAALSLASSVCNDKPWHPWTLGILGAVALVATGSAHFLDGRQRRGGKHAAR